MQKNLWLACLLVLAANNLLASDGVTVEGEDGVVNVFGTDGDDHILISDSWDGDPTKALVISITPFAYEVCAEIDLTSVIFINVYAGDGDDILRHSSNALFVNLFGEAGNDDLYGNEYYLNGFDELVGGDDDDFIYSGARPGRANGRDGNDYIYGNTWSGNAPNAQTLVGGAGSDVIIGTPNADSIDALDDEYDFVDCGGGNDEVLADEGDNVVNCGNGGPAE